MRTAPALIAACGVVVLLPLALLLGFVAIGLAASAELLLGIGEEE